MSSTGELIAGQDHKAGPKYEVDAATGFMQARNWDVAFNAEKKTLFIEKFREILDPVGAAQSLGIHHDTVRKHYYLDPVFKKAMDDVDEEYRFNLRGVSRRSALNPKMVIERIFNLKAEFPEVYGETKSHGPVQVTINIDGALLENMKKREEIIDAQVISSTLENSQTEQRSASIV